MISELIYYRNKILGSVESNLAKRQVEHSHANPEELKSKELHNEEKIIE
jgi:hypothetical protein